MERSSLAGLTYNEVVRREVKRLLRQADRDLENARKNVTIERKREELGIVRLAVQEGIEL